MSGLSDLLTQLSSSALVKRLAHRLLDLDREIKVLDKQLAEEILGSLARYLQRIPGAAL
ncbi:hypothetical protein [Rhodococcus opacus]|uniref:hypothetical protein n=1 Tax=Rhodococcus opacus TaxID=37919 RepID=UPI001300AD7F|nr:hypothetical protein [Rhodococcus opacus]